MLISATLLCSSNLGLLIAFNNLSDKNNHRTKLRRVHTILAYLALAVITASNFTLPFARTAMLATLIISIAGNTSLLISFLSFPISLFLAFRRTCQDQVIAWRLRGELAAIIRNYPANDIKIIWKEIAALVIANRSNSIGAIKENKSILFKNKLGLSRETTLLICLSIISIDPFVAKATSAFFGTINLARFIAALSWLIILSAIWRGVKAQVLLSGIANKLWDMKEQTDAAIATMDHNVREILELLFSTILVAIFRRLKLAPNSVHIKIEKFFSGVDITFDYLLNAVRLIPLIYSGFSFAFRFFIISLISGSVIALSMPQSSPIRVALDLSTLFFGGEPTILATLPSDMTVLISNLHIVTWVAQFTLFTFLATAFSISITHLTEKTQKLYGYYKKPIRLRVNRAAKGVSQHDLRNLRNSIIKQIEKNRAVPDDKKDSLFKSIDELETAIENAFNTRL